MSTVPSPYADAPRLPEGSDLGPALLVGADSPIELEIGPGRGGFLFERLAADPGVRIVGLEIRRKWATLVDRRLAALGYGARARVFAEDAREALKRFAPSTVEVVFVHFPDPWWKKRHH
jgi:tRNA (guanine-N7-)-methyltransferase